MEEEFGRKSIAASKAKLARENLRQGKPPCYSDHGVSRLYGNCPENGASPCGGCPDMLDCHLEVGLSELGMIDVTPDCYGDPATLDLDNPNETCRACPVRARCGSIVYERERVGQRHVIEEDAIASTGVDTASPVAPQVNQGEAQPHADPSPPCPSGAAPMVAAMKSPVEVYGGEHAGTPSGAIMASATPPVPEVAGSIAGGTVDRTPESQPPYTFPVSDADVEGRYKAMATDKLMAELEQLSYGKCPSSGQRTPYQEVRRAVCAISLELTLRGGCCPGFRPMRKVLGPKQLSDDEKRLSNDRQVLDLHWLWRNRRVKGGIYHEPLHAEQFSFDWAADFVSRRGSAAQKAKALALAETDQLLLAVIQTCAVAERRRTIQTEIEATWQAIANLASSPASRLSSQAVAQLQNVHIALRIARGSPTLACEVLLAMTGEVVDPRTMAAKKSWFARHGLPVE